MKLQNPTNVVFHIIIIDFRCFYMCNTTLLENYNILAKVLLDFEKIFEEML